jgi:DNA replication protein DnaC
MARADGSLRHRLAWLRQIEVLMIDDWAMALPQESEHRDFWEICEDRYQCRSSILTSQVPVAKWHKPIGDPTVTGGILDRLVQSADRIKIRGESMRRAKSGEANPARWEREAS